MQRLYVPATVANLGSGFDVLGVALNLYLEVEYQLGKQDVFLYKGEGEIDDNPNNIVHQAVAAAFATLNEKPPPLEINVFNPIPLARGMGSSAAARVAGAMIADQLLGGRLGTEGVFAVASKLEGHPDNVAPAVFGGFQLALQEPLIHQDLAYREDLFCLLAVPNFELTTSSARDALPTELPLSDAVFNLARSALWPAALATGNLELMREAARDRLHQPYRLKLMPGAEIAITAALNLGVPAFVAGAGPSLAALFFDMPDLLLNIFNKYIGETGRIFRLSIGGGAKWKAI